MSLFLVSSIPASLNGLQCLLFVPIDSEGGKSSGFLLHTMYLLCVTNLTSGRKFNFFNNTLCVVLEF